MDQLLKHKNYLWHALVAALALAAMGAFLEDIIKADWVAWLVPPASGLTFVAMLWKLKAGTFARNALWFVALLVVAFVGIYDVLDFFLDPIIRSDLLIGGTALLVLAGLGSSFSAIVAVEEG